MEGEEKLVSLSWWTAQRIYRFTTTLQTVKELQEVVAQLESHEGPSGTKDLENEGKLERSSHLQPANSAL